MPFPTPLFPFGGLADCAIASELMVVESNTVMAGGTTAANLPAFDKNSRRSASADSGPRFIVTLHRNERAWYGQARDRETAELALRSKGFEKIRAMSYFATTTGCRWHKVALDHPSTADRGRGDQALGYPSAAITTVHSTL